MLEDRLSRLEDRYDVIHGRVAPLEPNLYEFTVNQPVNLIDPFGLDWVAPNPNWPPVTGPYGPPPGPWSKLGKCLRLLRLVNCTACGLGTLAIEASCGIYSNGSYDWQTCVCDQIDSNAAWKFACNGCFSPLSWLTDVKAYFGCP
jgi:hypothetical protein